MNLRFIFWFLMLLILIFSQVIYWPEGQVVGWKHYGPSAMSFLTFVLIGILGWKVYGPAVTSA